MTQLIFMIEIVVASGGSKMVCAAYLWDNVKIWNKCGLEDDWDVWGVEQFDGVRRVLATVTGRLDGKVHAEPLKKDNSNQLLYLYYQDI